MGSPVSPPVANVFMEKFESRALELFEGTPEVWFRFINDVFSIVKRIQIEELLSHLNKQHESIKFTVEIEQNGRLPFMDLLLQRRDRWVD